MNGPYDELFHPGARFGRLTLIEYSHTNKHRSRCYVCRCDCGIEKAYNRNDLRSGSTVSCGCLGRERISEACKGVNNVHYSHGGARTKLYRVWHGMLERCTDPNHISYSYYGGKGITVCDEWRNFPAFRDWALAHGYKDGLSIDRSKSSLNYAPENCEWVTRSENTARGNRTRAKEATI